MDSGEGWAAGQRSLVGADFMSTRRGRSSVTLQGSPLQTEAQIAGCDDSHAVFAGEALLPDGWARDVRIVLDGGSIERVEVGANPELGDERVDVAIPGMPNLHSHAFQRGMAGRAEVRGSSADTFWTWREVMYRFALTMSPEQMEAVAAQAYVEMLESGFTRVGEFHYLHHAQDGTPYDDPAEMAERIASASQETGIALTLLPVFYAHATFGGVDPQPHQRRFISNLDLFARMMERSRDVVASLPGGRIGVAPHSLRAVTPDELAAVVAMAADGPVHIHAAEQVREVEDCLAWCGQRPVAWLLDHADVDDRWCLIHATHLDAEETARLAASGAVAGLCPITEANLGDGIFPGQDFLRAGGRVGVGTDSNVLIGAAAELRQLEYAQRLGQRERNVMVDATGPGSTGRSLVDRALQGGSQALCGVDAPFGLRVGAAADVVSLNVADAPACAGDAILDAWLFAGERSVRVDDVWVGGRQVVSGGYHPERDAIRARFNATIRDLVNS